MSEPPCAFRRRKRRRRRKRSRPCPQTATTRPHHMEEHPAHPPSTLNMVLRPPTVEPHPHMAEHRRHTVGHRHRTGDHRHRSTVENTGQITGPHRRMEALYHTGDLHRGRTVALLKVSSYMCVPTSPAFCPRIIVCNFLSWAKGNQVTALK